MPNAAELSIKLFADGADIAGMIRLAEDPRISGFTTNPTLMRQSGVSDYEQFARAALEVITRHPISFEVFSDEFEDMAHQARRIASWGDNVYVKIPVTNTRGETSGKLIRELSEEGLRLNVTAILSLRQVDDVVSALVTSRGAVVSVFAGRIADTGVDPAPLMASARQIVDPFPALELLWASPREVQNVCAAEAAGCHIITLTHELLNKLDGLGRDLEEVSLATVKMFYDDAQRVGYRL